MKIQRGLLALCFLLITALVCLSACGKGSVSETENESVGTEEKTLLQTEKNHEESETPTNEPTSEGSARPSDVMTEEDLAESNSQAQTERDSRPLVSSSEKEKPTEPTESSMPSEEMQTESKATEEKPTSLESEESIDYEEYLSLDEKEYVQQTIELSYSQYITDEEINEAIEEILMEYGTPSYRNDRAAIEGDTVNICYKGVITDEGGNEIAFDGGTYMNFGSPYPLTLGSGTFIEGFESGLIGVIPKDTYRFENDDETLTVLSDSVIHITYEASYDDNGTLKTKTGKNVLEALENKTFGEAFANAMLGAKAGETRTFDTSYDIDADKLEENVSMTVTLLDIAVLNPCAVMAIFPDPYAGSPELAGKTVKFYVWVESITEIVPAELTEEFVVNTLEVEIEEGENAIDVFKKQLKDFLQEERDGQAEADILNAAHEKLLEKAVFKKLPEEEIEEFYQSLFEELEYYFYYYGAYYGCKTVEEFAPIYFGEAISDLDKYLSEYAEKIVKFDLIQKYLCQKHGLIVDEKTIAEEVEKLFQEEADYANAQNPGVNYTAESMREELEAIYGVGYFEEYMSEQLHRELLNEFLISNCIIVYTAQ